MDSPPIYGLHQELWTIILKDLPFETIVNLCTVNKSLAILRESKDLWLFLLRRDYPFVDVNNHPNIKISGTRSCYHLCVAVRNDLDKRADFLYKHYATCNKKYIMKDLVIKDVAECLAKNLLDYQPRNVHRVVDMDDICEFADDVLAIMSGLDSAYVGHHSYGYLDFDLCCNGVGELRNTLSSMLEDYDIPVEDDVSSGEPESRSDCDE